MTAQEGKDPRIGPARPAHSELVGRGRPRLRVWPRLVDRSKRGEDAPQPAAETAGLRAPTTPEHTPAPSFASSKSCRTLDRHSRLLPNRRRQRSGPSVRRIWRRAREHDANDSAKMPPRLAPPGPPSGQTVPYRLCGRTIHDSLGGAGLASSPRFSSLRTGAGKRHALLRTLRSARVSPSGNGPRSSSPTFLA
jgi:hypothetical protein